jgi:hypothetical protein
VAVYRSGLRSPVPSEPGEEGHGCELTGPGPANPLSHDRALGDLQKVGQKGLDTGQHSALKNTVYL